MKKVIALIGVVLTGMLPCVSRAQTDGSRRDEAFTAYIQMMVKDHTTDLAAFQKEAKATQDAKLKGTVDGAIPVIEEHLSMAKNDSIKVAAR
jgi:predicted outer membrane protein